MSYMQLTYLHLGTLAPAFVLGTYLLINRKGTPAHQLLGKLYMGLMLFTYRDPFYGGSSRPYTVKSFWLPSFT